jgi:hypothetical protein
VGRVALDYASGVCQLGAQCNNSFLIAGKVQPLGGLKSQVSAGGITPT